MEQVCDLCNNKLVESGSRILGDVEYRILKCETCKRQVIRRVD